MVRHLIHHDGRWQLLSSTPPLTHQALLSAPPSTDEKTALLDVDNGGHLRPPPLPVGLRSRSGSIKSEGGVAEGETVDVVTGLSALRWWALFIFSAISVVQNVAWIAYSTVVDEATEYYGATDAQIQRLVAVSAGIFVPAVFVYNPLSDRLGLRAVVIGSAATVAAGAAFRWAGGRSYTWVFVGQTVNGLAGPMACNAPPQLASQWFPLEQRATATAIAWSAQALGVAAAYLIVPYAAPHAGDIRAFNEWLGYVSVGVAALALTFPPPPALPASPSSAFEKHGFFVGANKLRTNRSYICLGLAWAVSTGVLVAASSFLNIYMSEGNLKGRFSNDTIGWVGFAGNIANLAGVIVVPFLVDVFGLQKRMKWIAAPLYFLLGLCTFAMGVFITRAPPGTSVWVISIPYFLSSFLYGAVTPLSFELAGELVFPVAEETASAWINISYIVINVSAVVVFNHISAEASLFGSASVVLAATLLLFGVDDIHLRYDIDRAGLSPPSSPAAAPGGAAGAKRQDGNGGDDDDGEAVTMAVPGVSIN